MAKLGKSKTEKAKQAVGKKTKPEKARAKLAKKTDEAGKKVRKVDEGEQEDEEDGQTVDSLA